MGPPFHNTPLHLHEVHFAHIPICGQGGLGQTSWRIKTKTRQRKLDSGWEGSDWGLIGLRQPKETKCVHSAQVQMKVNFLQSEKPQTLGPVLRKRSSTRISPDAAAYQRAVVYLHTSRAVMISFGLFLLHVYACICLTTNRLEGPFVFNSLVLRDLTNLIFCGGQLVTKRSPSESEKRFAANPPVNIQFRP